MDRLLSKFAIALVLASAAAHVAAQHKHPHALKSQHGGEVLEGKRHHFELVLLPKPPGSSEVEISLYVTNHHNKPVKLEHAAGEALAASAGRQTRVALALAGANVLRGSASFAASADLVVEVTVMIGKLPAEKFVFRPLAAKR